MVPDLLECEEEAIDVSAGIAFADEERVDVDEPLAVVGDDDELVDEPVDEPDAEVVR